MDVGPPLSFPLNCIITKSCVINMIISPCFFCGGAAYGTCGIN